MVRVGQDRIIASNVNLSQIHVQLSTHLRPKDDPLPILQVIFYVLWFLRIDDAVHIVIGEIVPQAI
jgi:hypothetical protein